MNIVKQLIVACTLMFGSLLFAQDNVFLKREFWDTKPDQKTIKEKIKAGNNPSEANSNNFDGVVYAILQDAPTESIVFLMSQEGNDVNKLTHDGRTYIFWAAYKGNTEVMEHLLKNGAKTDLTDDKGNTIVTFAAGAGQQNTKVYDIIFNVDKGQITKTTPSGANALLLGAPKDDELKLTTYFESKGLSLKSEDSEGNGIFNYVAKAGNISLMKKLVSKGLKGNNNAYSFAAYGTRGHTNGIEVYQYLESVGLDPNVTDNEGVSPLHILASRNKDLDIINYFLKKGLEPSDKDKSGNNAVMNAASRNDLKIVKALVGNSKKLYNTNKKGQSALSLAVKGNSNDVVQYLIDKGYDTNIVDEEGNNLVYYLVSGYSPRNEDAFYNKLKLLKSKGLDLTSVQKNGNTFYHLAVEKQNLKLLTLAAKQEIDINAKNNEGNTALHLAAMKAKDAKILQFLIEQGANIKARTEFDESAYDLASENELLKKNNVSIDFLK